MLDNNPWCWHRPGKVLRGEDVRQCRNCGVAIEPCPCEGKQKRCESACRACDGSGWVGMLRSKRATVEAVQ